MASPSSAAPALSIELLGPVRVDVAGAPLAVDTRKAVALLAYLAVTDRPASREGLAALLWPDADGEDARGALRRTLSVLNAALGGRLAIDRTAVALGEDVEVDLRTFRAALGRARAHGHGPDESCPACLAALEAAVALDRGDFMAGFALRDSETFDEWQLGEAESHRRDLAGALERLARGRLAGREWAAAGIAARRWLELDPLHEPAHRLLMTPLARSGEQAAAIRQYRECVRILDAELGVAPLAETTELYEAIRADRSASTTPALPVPPAPASTTALPLVGRNMELQALIRAYGSVGPDGRLLLIEGEPGIGKTRLAAAVAEAVRSAGGSVLETRAYAGEATIAFGAIVELLRGPLARPDATARLAAVRPGSLAEVARLVSIPGLNAASDPAATPDPFGRSRLFEGLAEVITALAASSGAGSVAGLVEIDDLHWADASTIEFVGYLARRLRGRLIAVLVTWRPEESSDEDRDRVAQTAERAGLVERATLGRLGRDEVARLAAATIGDRATDELVDALFAESEGLPLYIAEALAAPPSTVDAGSIPGGVLALLRSRIVSVGEVAAQMLAAAAVIGRSFDLDTVRSASGRSEDEAIAGLDELVRRGLIREVEPGDGGSVRYDFTHGRLRDVAYEAQGLARRRLLHRRVAEALGTASGPATLDAGRWPLVAYHEGQAGRAAQAAEAHRRAGDLARSVFSNREAREHLETALALGHPAVVELHEALGDVLTLQGDYSGAIGHLESAAALAGPPRQAAIEHRLALVHARRGDWARAESHAAAALAASLATSPGDTIARSAILADRSAIAHRMSDPAGAQRLASEALELAEDAADGPSIARALDVAGIVDRGRGDGVAARSTLERAVHVAETTGDLGLQVASLNSLALVCADAGDRERAIALTVRALGLCERQGDRHSQAALENNLADLLHATGRGDVAIEHLKRAVAIFAEVGGQPGELEPEIWKLVEW